MPRASRKLLQAVERAVIQARPLAMKHFRNSKLRIERKADQSPVTIADRRVEAYLRKALSRLCPGETIIGEEFGRTGKSPDNYWAIDPIDGTRAFSRGLPTWCIMVGKVEAGKPVLGICDFPALGTTLAVAPGVAAYEKTGKSVKRLTRAVKPPALKDSVVFHGGAKWWNQSPYKAGFNRLIDSCYLERAYGDCYGFLWALRGHADIVIEYGVKVWDMVPLAALASATGRVLVNVHNHPSWTGPDTVMTHPRLAQQVTGILRRKA